MRERRREIGLRWVVGAKPRDILYQFLAEAVLLSGRGGSLGIGLGTAAAEILDILCEDGEDSARTVAAPLLTGAAIGTLFDLYPAAQAA